MQVSTAILQNRPTAPALRTATREGLTFENTRAQESLSIREYGSCFHGFFLGLCLEGALALCLYGIYLFGHVIR